MDPKQTKARNKKKKKERGGGEYPPLHMPPW
jgi:hypothetical protein